MSIRVGLINKFMSKYDKPFEIWYQYTKLFLYTAPVSKSMTAYRLGLHHGLPDLSLNFTDQLVGRAAVRDHALFEHDRLAGNELHVGDHVGGDDDGFVEDNAGKE